MRQFFILFSVLTVSKPVFAEGLVTGPVESDQDTLKANLDRTFSNGNVGVGETNLGRARNVGSESEVDLDRSPRVDYAMFSSQSKTTKELATIDPLLASETAWLRRRHVDPMRMLGDCEAGGDRSEGLPQESKQRLFRVGKALTIVLPEDDAMAAASNPDQGDIPGAPTILGSERFSGAANHQPNVKKRVSFQQSINLETSVSEDKENLPQEQKGSLAFTSLSTRYSLIKKKFSCCSGEF